MKIKEIRLLLSISIFSILLSCSATGSLYQETQLSNTDNALIYIYRPDKFVKSGLNYSIYINDKFIVELANNGYTVIEIQPKNYTIAVRRSRSEFYSIIKKSINLNKSDVVYIKYKPINDIKFAEVLAGIIIMGILTGSSSGVIGSSDDRENKLEIIDSEIAKKEIASSYLQRYVDLTLEQNISEKMNVTESENGFIRNFLIKLPPFIKIDDKGKFIKVSSTGEFLSADAQNWSCVYDKNTQLMWEVKTNDGGIHDRDNSYRWGGKGGKITFYSVQQNDTKKYNDWDTLIDSSNKEQLCGKTDWEVPTLKELDSLIDYNTFTLKSSFKIHTKYFPNTLFDDLYWVASSATRTAIQLSFKYGKSYDDRSNYLSVRLVNIKSKEKQCNKKGVTHSKRFRGVEAGCER